MPDIIYIYKARCSSYDSRRQVVVLAFEGGATVTVSTEIVQAPYLSAGQKVRVRCDEQGKIKSVSP